MYFQRKVNYILAYQHTKTLKKINRHREQGLKEKLRMALEQSKKTEKKTQQNSRFGTCLHTNFELKFPIIE